MHCIFRESDGTILKAFPGSAGRVQDLGTVPLTGQGPDLLLQNGDQIKIRLTDPLVRYSTYIFSHMNLTYKQDLGTITCPLFIHQDLVDFLLIITNVATSNYKEPCVHCRRHIFYLCSNIWRSLSYVPAPLFGFCLLCVKLCKIIFIKSIGGYNYNGLCVNILPWEGTASCIYVLTAMHTLSLERVQPQEAMC